MYDARYYSDTFDLYRPTVSTSASHRQQVTEPVTATSTGNRCRYVGTPGTWRMGAVHFGETGPDLAYDAKLLCPAGTDLLPIKRGDQPDVVEIDSRRFVVTLYFEPHAADMYGVALL
ncbi:MAG TPA: hypothetical protein VMW48_10700, partial [Vicinamibacterales bacterium]|nr:hypothetical protein [Vicinamibacterales bacterium]